MRHLREERKLSKALILKKKTPKLTLIPSFVGEKIISMKHFQKSDH